MTIETISDRRPLIRLTRSEMRKVLELDNRQNLDIWIDAVDLDVVLAARDRDRAAGPPAPPSETPQ